MWENHRHSGESRNPFSPLTHRLSPGRPRSRTGKIRTPPRIHLICSGFRRGALFHESESRSKTTGRKSQVKMDSGFRRNDDQNRNISCRDRSRPVPTAPLLVPFAESRSKVFFNNPLKGEVSFTSVRETQNCFQVLPNYPAPAPPSRTLPRTLRLMV